MRGLADVLAELLAHLGAVHVHCIYTHGQCQTLSEKGGSGWERRRRTRFLEEHGLPIEHAALVPRHAVAQLVDADLPLAGCPAHAWDGDLADAGDGDEGAGATTGARVHLNAIIVVVLEEADAVGRWRRVLHLHREPGARVHGAALAEGVRDLVRVDCVEGSADADALLLGRLVDDDELGLLGLGDVAEEGEVVVVLGLGLRGNGMVGVLGHRRSGIAHRGSHGGAAYGRVWWVTTGVAWVDMALADILG